MDGECRGGLHRNIDNFRNPHRKRGGKLVEAVTDGRCRSNRSVNTDTQSQEAAVRQLLRAGFL